jgi:hypothetical protein
LVEAGAEIVSTGSTAATIAGAGLPVTAIEQVTGFPECLDGRVKPCTRQCTLAYLPIFDWNRIAHSLPSVASSHLTC